MHQPHDHPVSDSQRVLKVGIALTFCIFLLEFFGGLWTQSLALMSDAWHVFIDVWALVLSFLALLLARRPATHKKTFGMHRMEVFATGVNGLTVFLIAIGILYSAWKRWAMPVPIQTGPLLGLATVGLLLNLVVAALLYKPSRDDSNLQGAFLHVAADTLSSVAVVLAALAIRWTGISQIDAGVSVLIAVVVLWSSGRLLRDAINTLLEGVPSGIKVIDVERQITQVPGVISVHDLHVWSICSHLNALSGHVLLREDRMADQHQVLETIGKQLRNQFGISHTTIQLESKSWPTDEAMDHAGNG